MAELSKTARASMKSGQVTKTDPFDTNAKKIKELRNQRTSGIFVTRGDFIDALLEEYDFLLAGIKRASEEAGLANESPVQN